jgi:hypothetical protein
VGDYMVISASQASFRYFGASNYPRASAGDGFTRSFTSWLTA